MPKGVKKLPHVKIHTIPFPFYWATSAKEMEEAAPRTQKPN
jgi:hypothetical protein